MLHTASVSRWILLISIALGAAACGKDDHAAADASPPDAATADAAGFAEAAHPAPPQVQTLGGPVLGAPKVVPVFFAGDDVIQAQIEPFLAALAASPYWSATTQEYGVGALTIEPSIVTTDPPPTTDAGLQAWLASNTDGTHPAWPQADGNTLFAVYLPSGVSISTDFGDSCTSFGGYHNEVQGGAVVYALMPRCPSPAPPIDLLSIVTSHELVEAATDPHPFGAPAYADMDPDHYVWALVPGPELGDMCEYVREANQRLVGTYAVQRTWSNAAALAGHDPCVPALDAPFVTAAPVLEDPATIQFDPQNRIITKGATVANGATQQIDLQLFSDAPADAWTIEPIDVASVVLNGAPELALSIDRSTGQNGDVLKLSINRLRDGANGGSEFLLSSRVNDRSVSLWWGYVANGAIAPPPAGLRPSAVPKIWQPARSTTVGW